MTLKKASKLAGIRILITRPSEQANDLRDAIKALGGIPVVFPVLAIEPIPNTQKIETAISILNTFDYVIFVSRNAVKYAAPTIHATWNTWPKHCQSVAIGPATHKALQDSQLPSDLTAQPPYNSESLMTRMKTHLGALSSLKNKKIILFRGNEGRRLLSETLKENGAHVTEIQVYQRVPAKHNTPLPNYDTIDVVIITSGEGFKAFYDRLGEQQNQWRQNVTLCVLSERIANIAKGYGFIKPMIVAKSASNAGIIDALRNAETMLLIRMQR